MTGYREEELIDLQDSALRTSFSGEGFGNAPGDGKVRGFSGYLVRKGLVRSESQAKAVALGMAAIIVAVSVLASVLTVSSADRLKVEPGVQLIEIDYSSNE